MRQRVFLADVRLIIPVLLLIFFSLTTLLSINPVFFKGQLISLAVGILFFIFFASLDYRFLKHFMIPLYGVSLVLLALLFLVGTEARGATRWLEMGGFRIQFSEVLKPFLLLSLASWLEKHEERKNGKVFLLTMLAAGFVSFLVFLEPDLGNAVVYVGVVLLLLFYVGFPLRFFVGTILLGLLTFPLFWLLLRDYQRDRILTFLNPSLDPQGTSYNTIQAMIAVGSGGFFGRGLGFGTQSQLRFLPERHTDFIFAAIAEQFGFVGAVSVIVLLGLILWRVYVLARDAEDRFGKLFAVSAFCLLILQSFMNIGMNLGLLPIAGVTLPLLSFGGSSLLSTCILLGILSSVSRTLKYKEPLEIR